jgi:hypothetical protein
VVEEWGDADWVSWKDVCVVKGTDAVLKGFSGK